MVVHSKGSSLVFKDSSQYAVEKPLLGIIEPYMQSQEKLGVIFSQTLFVLVLAFCFFTLCDTKTTPSSILSAILIFKKPLNNNENILIYINDYLITLLLFYWSLIVMFWSLRRHFIVKFWWKERFNPAADSSWLWNHGGSVFVSLILSLYFHIERDFLLHGYV